MKESASFKVGDRVKVSAEVTGYGIAPTAVVTDVEIFMRRTFVSVVYIEPSEVGGQSGCTVTNLGMLQHID